MLARVRRRDGVQSRCLHILDNRALPPILCGVIGCLELKSRSSSSVVQPLTHAQCWMMSSTAAGTTR